MKIMAIDLGDVRTGVAFSDITGFIAGRSVTITCRDREALADQICDMIQKEGAQEIVLGQARFAQNVLRERACHLA